METHTNSSLQGLPDEIALSSILNEAGETIVYVDYNWKILYCNDVYLQSVGEVRENVVGKTPFEYQPNFGRSVFWQMMDKCGRDRKVSSMIGYSTVMKRWLMVRVFPLKNGALMLANDATENVVQQYQLAAQAIKDSLTGLPNAIALTQDMTALIERKQPFLLMILGLDRFRIINDALGHAGGDMALLEMSSRFQSSTEDGETLYRLSADEFVIVRKQGDPISQERFDTFSRVAQDPIVLYGQSFVLGVSAGVCTHPNDGIDSSELLRRAGLALHRAKRAGRGKAYPYVSGLEAESILRTQIETELREAIKDDAFELVFQPKGDINSNRINGAEALIRWNHKSRGFLSPFAFLPIAEECKLMKSIDLFVLRQTVKTIAAWKKQGITVPVSINISTDSLSDRALIKNVRDALDEFKVDPCMLEIEIPEGALISDFNTGIEVLKALQTMGLKISVDDFGTGYSSFTYLNKFPISTLKIDRSFITEINGHSTESEFNKKIVKSIIRMAHSLQLDVVAEGVETVKELDVLKKLHCNTVQGYLFSKPLPPGEFIKFAKKNATEASRIDPMSM